MDEAKRLHMAHDMSLEDLMILQRQVNYAIAEFAMRGAKLDRHVDAKVHYADQGEGDLHTSPAKSATTSLRRRAI